MDFPLLAFSGVVAAAKLFRTWKSLQTDTDDNHCKDERVAVNFHFTRQCNYNCGFCFHTAKTSHVESEEKCKEILILLRKGGFKKINFAGGEPFVKPELLGIMCKYAKEVCKYESVSIISNGSKCKEEWFKKYARYVDILGVSCDSFDEKVNKAIGRGNGNHLKSVRQVAAWCKSYNIQFKLNTVVNSFNHLEDISSFVNELSPIRWKIFQVLALEGENTGENTKRQVEKFLISEKSFQDYVSRNTNGLIDQTIVKMESNDVMKSSYVLVDEYGCFLDSSKGGKEPTGSILSIGVDAAWKELIESEGGGYDSVAFNSRDGGYKQSCWTTPKLIPDMEDLFKGKV
jgi:radical S-adenosyl methionine domain-containing protein 2